MHRLVATAFLGMDIGSPMVVNHRNGNGLDNRIQNLEVCTRKQNSEHASAKKLFNKNTIKRFTREQKSKLVKDIMISEESFEEIKRQFSI